jgi:hypothetical protein
VIYRLINNTICKLEVVINSFSAASAQQDLMDLVARHFARVSMVLDIPFIGH